MLRYKMRLFYFFCD